jgi:hypothetical protein
MRVVADGKCLIASEANYCQIVQFVKAWNGDGK